MRRTINGLMLAACTAACLAGTPALADQPQWWHDDIHRFHEHDIDVWRHGRWFHGDHLGRAGWWWIVGGVWYFYPAPVYPYPDPYVPPVAVAPIAPQYYYWCRVPAGYYPQVPACRVPWQAVPAVAPAIPAPMPVPPPPAASAPPTDAVPAPANQPPPPPPAQ